MSKLCPLFRTIGGSLVNQLKAERKTYSIDRNTSFWFKQKNIHFFAQYVNVNGNVTNICQQCLDLLSIDWTKD